MEQNLGQIGRSSASFQKWAAEQLLNWELSSQLGYEQEMGESFVSEALAKDTEKAIIPHLPSFDN
jgi:hypothetical protein